MILYFTGTGNSRAVATLLAAALGENTPRAMEPGLRDGSLTLPAPGRRVVWVFPVYSWGVPPYVLEVIKGLKWQDTLPHTVTHHLVLVCGDDCGYADLRWRRAIASRGWHTGSATYIQMPNNYVAMRGFDIDPLPVEQAKLEACLPTVVSLAAVMLDDEARGTCTTAVKRGAFPWVKSRVINPWFVKHAMNPGRFRVDAASCTGCGKCQRRCPLGNIRLVPAPGHAAAPAPLTLAGRIPSWGSDCAGCLGCYHVCPVHAVAYGKHTAGKGQYYLADTTRITAAAQP